MPTIQDERARALGPAAPEPVRRGWCLAALGVFGAVVLAVTVWLWPTLRIAAADGLARFGYQRTYWSRSPDDMRMITVTKRVRFPANRSFDPAVTVRVTLIDSSSDRVLSERTLDLEHESDLGVPRFLWFIDAPPQVAGLDSNAPSVRVVLSGRGD